MNKRCEQITKRLAEIEQAKVDKRKKFESELENARKKLESNQTDLQNADDPEEYKKLLRERTEHEAYIDFLTARRNSIPKLELDRDEFLKMSDTILDEIEKLQSEYTPKIKRDLDTLIKTVNEYYEEAIALDKTRERATQCFLNHGVSVWKTNTIVDKIDDPLFYGHKLLAAFFMHRGYIESIVNKLKSPVWSKHGYACATTEEAMLVNELKRRLKV